MFVGSGRIVIFNEQVFEELLSSDNPVETKLAHELSKAFEKCDNELQKKLELVKYEKVLKEKITVLERMATNYFAPRRESVINPLKVKMTMGRGGLRLSELQRVFKKTSSATVV